MNIHRDLERAYAERAELRASVFGSQRGYINYRARSHALALKIHRLEMLHGRVIYRFVRCEVCGQCRPAASRQCGQCVALLTLWSIYGDNIHVEA